MAYCVEYYMGNQYRKKNFKNVTDMDVWTKKMNKKSKYKLKNVILTSRNEIECINCGSIEIEIKYLRGYSDWFEMPLERIDFCKNCGLIRYKDPTIKRFYAYLKQRGYEWDKDWHDGCWVNRVNYIRYFILQIDKEGAFGQGNVNGFTYMIQGERDTIHVSAKNTDFTSLCQLVIDLENELKKKKLPRK